MTSMRRDHRQKILSELANRRTRRERGELRPFDGLTPQELRESSHAAMVLAEADVGQVPQGNGAAAPMPVLAA
jgi:hypothetical protein